MRIILHIGAGKTGSSSLQESLSRSSAALSAHGVAYAGEMLDRAPVQVARWQRPGVDPTLTFAELRRMPPREAKFEVLRALRANITAFEAEGITSLIWSNERFFEYSRIFTLALQKLIDEGHDVTVVAYVRRHDSWARSVHNQLHVRRTRVTAPALSFRDFVDAQDFTYARHIRPWNEALGSRLRLRNFDATSDVVGDFCSASGVSPDLLQSVRSNDTQGHEETVLRVLFNATIDSRGDGSRPRSNFNRLLHAGQVDFTSNPVAKANAFMPSEDDLHVVAARTADDRDEINELLTARGQPPLEVAVAPPAPLRIDDQAVDSALFQLLIQQAHDIQDLKAEVQRLGRILNDS